MKLPWPHAPAHWTFDPGLYIITAGTCHKQPLLNTPDRRDMVLRHLFVCANEFGWHLQAWAVMINHYHLVARTEDATTLVKFMKKLHANTSRELNRADGMPGRKVWFEYWDTHITNEKSWLARLRYVNTNPVHHGVTHDATSYPWCSSGWFASNANASFVETLARFKTDAVSVPDDF